MVGRVLSFRARRIFRCYLSFREGIYVGTVVRYVCNKFQ